MPDMIRSGSLEGYLELMEELGGNTPLILKQAGLNKSIFHNPDTLVPFSCICDLLERSATHCKNRNLGILLSHKRRGLTLGLIGLICLQSPDVKTAILKTIDNFHLHNMAEDWELKTDGPVTYAIRHTHHPIAFKSIQTCEMAIGDVVHFMQSLCGQSLQLRSICFTHEAPPNTDIYKKFYGPNVLFNQEFNGITFNSAVLGKTINTIDEGIHKHLEHYIESMKIEMKDNVLMQTQRLIQQTMGMQNCNINNIANLMCMHKRTLQKKLEEEGVSFTELLEEARWNQAKQLLTYSKMPLSRIASLLNYSELSAFSRAFQRKHKTSPSAWRKANKTI